MRAQLNDALEKGWGTARLNSQTNHLQPPKNTAFLTAGNMLEDTPNFRNPLFRIELS